MVGLTWVNHVTTKAAVLSLDDNNSPTNTISDQETFLQQRETLSRSMQLAYTPEQIQQWVEVDQALYEGNYSNALEKIDALLEARNRDPLVRFKKGLVLEAIGEYQQALNNVRIGGVRIQNKKLVDLTKARLQAATGNTDAAIKWANRTLKEEPENRYAQLLLALIHVSKEEFNQAENLLIGWSFTDYAWLSYQWFIIPVHRHILTSNNNNDVISSWEESFFGKGIHNRASLQKIGKRIQWDKDKVILEWLNELPSSPCFTTSLEVHKTLVQLKHNQEEDVWLRCRNFMTNDNLNARQAKSLGVLLLEVHQYEEAAFWFENYKAKYPNDLALKFGHAVALSGLNQLNDAAKLVFEILKEDTELTKLFLQGEQESLVRIREHPMLSMIASSKLDKEAQKDIHFLVASKQYTQAEALLNQVPAQLRDTSWFGLANVVYLALEKHPDVISNALNALELLPDNDNMWIYFVLESLKSADPNYIDAIKDRYETRVKKIAYVDHLYEKAATNRASDPLNYMYQTLVNLRSLVKNNQGDSYLALLSTLPLVVDSSQLVEPAKFFYMGAYLHPTNLGWAFR